RKMCLYIEFSDLSQKMFGYRILRNEGYFPIQWMEIHNSLHSLSPKERINEKTLQRIERAHEAGVISQKVQTDEEINSFSRLLSRFFSLKVRRYLPPKKMFELLHTTGNGRLFVTKHKNKVIGGSCCIYSKNNVYLWYMASKRKSHPTLYPSAVTIWGAITDAYEQEKWHIYFMDVGLPFKKNRYRDFILSFGGKEVGTYRWFRFSLPWLNRLIGWFYRE
ncbi:MAG: GNAT family N-acetyltransferase, partial [Prevotella sp.]|nr:GNAT family N-acetyltransferase [Prevotella sp.]